MQNDNIKDYISAIVNSDSKRARAAALRDLLAAIPNEAWDEARARSEYLDMPTDSGDFAELVECMARCVVEPLYLCVTESEVFGY